MSYPIHPACAKWPRPPDNEVLALAESIKAEGLHNPIWLFDGAILDGKTRYEACQIAGVEPRFQAYTGDNPEQFTIAQNRLRRHMSTGALALIVAELSKLPRGGDRRSTDFKVAAATLNREDEDKTMGELAEAAGLARSTIADAKVVLQKAEPNVVEMVKSGKVGVRSAAAYVDRTPRVWQRDASPKSVRDEGYAQRKSRGSRSAPLREEARAIVRPLVESNAPVNTRGLATKHGGISHLTFEAAVTAERARLEALRERPDAEKHEKMVSIHVLIEELHPLFQRVLTQAKVHPARVSQGELAMVAGKGQRLLDQWASDDPSVRRLRGRVVPFKQSATKGLSNVSPLESAQQRDQGADP